MTSSILGLQQQRSSTTDLRYALKAEKFKSRPTIITTATSATSYAQDRSDPPLLLPSPRRENGNGITAKILHSHLQHPSAKYRRVPSAAPNGLLSEVDLKRWDNGW